LENILTFKQKAVSAYLGIGMLFALYGWLFGTFKHRGFFYNLGQGVVWPATLFPALGAFLGGIIMIVVIGAVVFLGGNGKSR
jgi:hypothetical protein